MRLVAYARPRSVAEEFFGHIVAGQEGIAASRFYGYRFDVAQVPDACQAGGETLTNFLFANATPGVIVDETNFVKALLARPASGYWKFAAWSGNLGDHIPLAAGSYAVVHARYSFNPDAFHSEADPCYNCVKWVYVVTNRVVPGFLHTVEKWRIKNVIQQMHPLPAAEKPSGE